MMRWIATLLLLLGAASASGQDAVPDPTPPEQYAPLGVGDIWHYYTPLSGWLSREVQRDTTVNDTTYAVVMERRHQFQGTATDSTLRLLRFDATTATMRQRVGERDTDAFYTACPLDTPFGGEEPYYCNSVIGGDETAVVGSTSETVEIGEETVVVASKTFSHLIGGSQQVAAGIGLVSFGEDAAPLTALRYAVVDGQAYGTPAPGLLRPIAAEPAPAAARLGVRAHPNPASGPLAVTVAVPEPARVTVKAFDALGRRVWHAEADVPPGETRLAVDAGGWAPGLYVVRATAGPEAATATVVRR